jgi:hypothetical protein
MTPGERDQPDQQTREDDASGTYRHGVLENETFTPLRTFLFIGRFFLCPYLTSCFVSMSSNAVEISLGV